MAKTFEVTRDIGRDITVVADAVLELIEIAADWDEASESEQVSFCLDWDHVMASYLGPLGNAFASGSMSPETEPRYVAVVGQLCEVMPIIVRLNLYRPPVSLDVKQKVA